MDGVGVEDGLGVGPCLDLAAVLAQGRVQLQVVVDLPVGGQGQVAVGADHGLVAGGQADDGQACLGQAHRARAVDALVIGSAVGQASGHQAQLVSVRAGAVGQDVAG